MIINGDFYSIFDKIGNSVTVTNKELLTIYNDLVTLMITIIN